MTVLLLGLGLAAALALLSALPGPLRPWARAGLVFWVVLVPVWGLAILLDACAERTELGTWLLFLPLTFVYLAALDLRFGVSARLAKGIGIDAERRREEPRKEG